MLSIIGKGIHNVLGEGKNEYQIVTNCSFKINT